MTEILFTTSHTLTNWCHAALKHARAVKRLRALPIWFALLLVCCDFCLVGLSFRYNPTSSLVGAAVYGVVQYLARLVLVTVALIWACKRYGVSGGALGIRPSGMASDFRWSFRISGLVGLVATIALAMVAIVIWWLGFHLPAPPELFVEAMGSKASARQFITLAGLGTVVVAGLAPVTEELVYRGVLFPAIVSRLGLFPAAGATAIVFGLLHVVPFGEVGIAVPQLIGGLVMAAGFSIRWSLIPAIVIHGLGNFSVGVLGFVYVRLYETVPALFVSQ